MDAEVIDVDDEHLVARLHCRTDALRARIAGAKIRGRATPSSAS